MAVPLWVYALLVWAAATVTLLVVLDCVIFPALDRWVHRRFVRRLVRKGYAEDEQAAEDLIDRWMDEARAPRGSA